MILNPNFTVRFYIRPQMKGISVRPTPLRVKVWISARKSYLYLTANTSITPLQFSYFATDGTPGRGADPQLLKVIDTYKAAIQLVISGAIVNGKIMDLTSEDLQIKVEGVVERMKAVEKSGNWRPITPFATPLNTRVCRGCVFAGDECSAPWTINHDRISAAEFADYNGICRNRCVNTAEGVMWQPNPSRDPQPFDKESQQRLYIEAAAAVIVEEANAAKEGGNNGK